jgi:hypothetical protein
MEQLLDDCCPPQKPCPIWATKTLPKLVSLQPMRAIYFLVGCLSLWALAACSTAVDINAPYKELPTVYALIDAGDSVNYIRIQKSFLTIREGNANVAAGTKDSIYYPSSVLRVTLQALSPTTGLPISSKPILILLEETVANKDTGLFYGPDQLLYKTPKTYLDPAYIYRLKVVNTRTLVEVTAITSVMKPLAYTDLVNPYRRANDGKYVFTSERPLVQWKLNSRDSLSRFQINVTIPIEETLLSGEVRAPKIIEWRFTPDRASDSYVSSNGVFLSVTDYQGDTAKFRAMFKVVKAGLDVNDAQVFSRRILPLTLTITRCNNQLAKYIDATGSYSVLTQTRPFYTNIVGGVGIFAARNVANFQVVADPNFTSVMKAHYPELKF